jgi:Zn-dependent protease
MRDPLSWSIPLFRAYGIQVRLHILYIIITLGFVYRAYTMSHTREDWYEYILIWVVILFLIILLHEFGHCFAARREGGDANEILMWPLGGLAYCEVPHSARAHFVTAAGGPMVNVMICIACAAALLPFRLLPPLNPLNYEHIYRPQLHNFSDGATYYSDDQVLLVKANTTEIVNPRYLQTFFKHKDTVFAKMEGDKEAFEVSIIVPQQHYNSVALWLARIFWMSWILLLFNLIPAYPLDGGRLLQSALWGRTSDYRRATIAAVYSGYAVAVIFVLISLFNSEVLWFMMAIFIWVFCTRQYRELEAAENESMFGYDFSQGYTSLEKDDPPPPKPRKAGPIKRWLQARRERRATREAELRAADEARMDELLDKIHRLGKEALTDEERRFMDRVSARYRNRS